ncbi:MAG TPA: NADPH-dependent F420 reductase [Chloroflexi bacterium]|nr:NADPH-dependent F420 reductase [Chloroflexota bacterium]
MTNDKKTLAVIGGTGNEGPGLAARWAASGKYDVIIGSRQAEKGERVAAELNAQLGEALLRGMANEDAVAACDLAALTVPYSAHRPTLEGLKEALKGKVLIDVTVPLAPPKVSHVKIPAGGSAGQEAQAILGDEVQVVSAFQNIGAAHLDDPERAIECDVLVCGNKKAAKAEAIALAEAAGMRGIDAGPLQNAVVVEGLTAVLIGINIRHKVKGAGIKITGI